MISRVLRRTLLRGKNIAIKKKGLFLWFVICVFQTEQDFFMPEYAHILNHGFVIAGLSRVMS